MTWLRRGSSAFALVTAFLLTAGTAALATGVDPATVTGTLAPGESLDVEKTVTAPVSPPKADVYFLADTTGSMGPALADVQASFADIRSALLAGGNDVAFGAGDYKDFVYDTYAFNNAVPVTDDGGVAAGEAAALWVAAGGGDGPEAQLYALHRLANGDAGFRDDASKVVVWFGDAPGHDPICAAYSGEPANITVDSVIEDLVDAGIVVIAVDSATSFSGLDASPSGGIVSGCDFTGPGGQATRIVTATGGVFQEAPDSGQVADTILSAMQAVPITIRPVATCDDGLAMSFAPEVRVVNGGDTASFTESIEVAEGASPGDLTCSVDWTINGGTGGDEFRQTVAITVPSVGDPDGAESCVDLIAGRTTPVGEVCVSDDGIDMVVTYTTVEGWSLVNTHLHVACEGTQADIPQNRAGNPTPGKFDHSVDHGPSSSVAYDIVGCTSGALAAHADVQSDRGHREGAWGEGSGFDGRNWAMWFNYQAGA